MAQDSYDTQYNSIRGADPLRPTTVGVQGKPVEKLAYRGKTSHCCCGWWAQRSITRLRRLSDLALRRRPSSQGSRLTTEPPPLPALELESTHRREHPRREMCFTRKIQSGARACRTCITLLVILPEMGKIRESQERVLRLPEDKCRVQIVRQILYKVISI